MLTVRKARIILPALLVGYFLLHTYTYSSEPKASDPFSGKYSTTYPSGEERTFKNMSDLFRFLKDPKKGVEKPKKDEFETDAEFAKRLRVFEAKFAAVQGNSDRHFSIEFSPTLGEYSHIFSGFPLNLRIYDYTARVVDVDNDFEAKVKTATYKIEGGNVLLSNYWGADYNKSLYMRAHTGHLNRNIRFRNDVVPLIVQVPDLGAAKRLRDNKAEFIARIEGTLVDSRQGHVIATGRISKSEGWSRSGGEYVARFESLGLHRINITKFVVRLGIDVYEVVTLESAKETAKNVDRPKTSQPLAFYAYRVYERSYYTGYNTSNRETFFDTDQKMFRDKNGNEHTWRIHAENYVYLWKENQHAWAPKVFFTCDGKSVEGKWYKSSENFDIGVIRFIQATEGKFKYFFLYRLDRGIENLPIEISEPANLFDIMED